jgi:acetyl-CoA carboxylase biotin carboxyl carrier protein
MDRKGKSPPGRSEISIVDEGELKELIQFISDSSFVEFEMERKGFKLRLIKAGARGTAGGVTNGGGMAEPAPAANSDPAGTLQAEAASASPAAAEAEVLHEVRSPIVGTFYRSPSPDAPSYVQAGDRVRKGQVLCIVEAMKLMNEIESDAAGEVVETLVANGQPVEYGEVLFRIRPVE